MKRCRRFFILVLLMFFFETGSVVAQVGDAVSIAGHGILALAGHGILALAGGNRQAKQDKLIEQSVKHEKISGQNVTILRVKESDIKSKAKSHIIALQNRLEQYGIQYKNNETVDIPKNDSDLIAIQNTDENWPVENYISELRAYKRYVFQQKQKSPTAPANTVPVTPGNNVKKDTSGAKL